MSKRRCAKNVCEICTNAVATKGMFGNKYLCRLGKKKSNGKCFYFTCSGTNASYCLTCPNYSKARGGNLTE